MPTEASEWAERADIAAGSVHRRFGHRMFGLPGTWIASVQDPALFPPAPWHEWHYWWQAHYLDALVDRAGRQLTEVRGPWLPGRGAAIDLGSGTDIDPDSGAVVDTGHAQASGWTRPARAADGFPAPLLLAERLLRTIRVRNYLRLSNNYYDDMAWLALAAGRATALTRNVKGRDLPGARRAIRTLGSRLIQGQTQDLGGGTFWSTQRDFKNTPATAPSALFFVRSGDPDRALRLTDWLRRLLFDPEQGLYMDGVHPTPEGPVVERTVYSYNQGPILTALLELGGERQLTQAADLIDAVAFRLTEPRRLDGGTSVGDGGPSGGDGGASGGDGGRDPAISRPLRLHGSGDGGLFTGILVRHLGAAAVWPGLPEASRAKAAALVLDTAEDLWAGRRAGDCPMFSSSITCPASQSYPEGASVELSTQLQAWTIFEAAHRLTSRPPE